MCIILPGQKTTRIGFILPRDMDLTFGYTSDPDFPWGTKYESYLYENYIWWEPGNRLMKTDAARGQNPCPGAVCIASGNGADG